MFTPVILAGGYGKRLWPYSSKQCPKQFLACLGKTTMFQQTLLRLEGFDHHPPVILCNEEHQLLVVEQLASIGIHNATLLLEPAVRNTAPAITLASLMAQDGDDVLLVLPADHYISDKTAFQKAVDDAVKVAHIQQRLVIFGIQPSSPETGYGYIQRGELIKNSRHCHSVESFIEKPDLKSALGFLASNDYFWNSGMLALKPSVYISELNTFHPTMLSACQDLWKQRTLAAGFIFFDAGLFSACPELSVDCAILEKTARAVVIPIQCGWSDIGSWPSILQIEEKDNNGNTCHGNVVTVDTTNCSVRSGHRLVATIGLQDLLIVESKDGVLVVHKSELSSLRKLFDHLDKQH